VGLNPPLQSQQNEGVGDCNEGNLNATIRWLGMDAIKAEFPTTLITKRGGQSWPLVQPAPARQPISIIVFNDSGRGSDPDGTDCTSESSIYLGPSLLSWRSKKQWDGLNLANSGANILWVQSLLTELKTPFQTQITFCDNSGVQSLLITQSSALPLELDIFVLEKVLSQNFIVHHIPTTDQTADFPTKPLCERWFICFSRQT